MTNAAPAPSMVVGIQHWDRSSALLDRRVTIPNVAIVGVPNAVSWAGLFDGVFDAAELPVARFVFNTGQGDELVALPIFPDRLFLHQYIYVRAGDPMTSLNELKGKRILLPGYYFTASFWHRHLLREAGVQPEDVEWVSTAPELDPRMRTPESIKISVERSASRGVDLLVDGRADCLMHEYTMPTHLGGDDRIRRLLTNVYDVQADWYRKSSVHPALHLIAVRADSLRRRPDFGIELCRAFDQARAEMYRWLQSERTTGLPFMREAIDRSLEVFGNDPWTYGLEKNGRELNKFLDLALADELIATRPDLEGLFDQRALEYRFESHM